MEVKPCGVSLPEDLVMEIFSRLPVEILLRFKCASKSCCNLISSPHFVKLHLSRSLDRNSGVLLLHERYSSITTWDFNHPQRSAVQLYPPDIPFEPGRHEYLGPAHIVGIANGVVCFSRGNEFVLYNPATRAFKQISRPQVIKVYGTYVHHQADFGYDCIGDDYKILSVAHLCKESPHTRYATERSLYSLKSTSWQKIENPPWHDGITALYGGTVFANNSFYWISDIEKGVITSFDIWGRRYRYVVMPLSPEIDVSSCTLRLGVLKGRVHAMKCGNGVGIWMLNKDHDWTLLFRCCVDPLSGDCSWPKPYAYSKDESKILVGPWENPKEFVCCDLNSQTTTMIDVLGLRKDASFTAFPWAESLVTLG